MGGEGEGEALTTFMKWRIVGLRVELKKVFNIGNTQEWPGRTLLLWREEEEEGSNALIMMLSRVLRGSAYSSLVARSNLSCSL